MSDQLEDKIDVINKMIVSLGKLTNAEIRLRIAGKDDLADQIAAKREPLRDEIDRLRGKVADHWAVDAATLTDDLAKANSKVQDAIRDIRNNINVAQSVVKLIGQIDGALAFLKTVAP